MGSSSLGNATTTSPAVSGEIVQPASSMQRVALHCTMLFLFFRISFLHEFITGKIRLDLHMLMLLGIMSLLTAFLTSRLTIGLGTRTARLWVGYAFCLCLATAGSSWRGGSIGLLLEYLRTNFPLLLLIPAVTYTTNDLIKILKTIGWAGIAVIGLGFSNKVIVEGRMILMNAASIGDSNDYAAYLIFVAPLVVFLLFGPGSKPFHKLLGLIVIPAGIFQVLSTGSRGALVGIAATLALVVVLSKPRVKLAMLIGLPTIALLALPLVPHKAVDRFASLFKSDAEDKTDATASSEARRRLLQQSITLTFTHPLLGVGPGQFMDSEGELAKASHERGMWHATHNTYTQVSSECGIPAFLFYVAAISVTLTRLWKLRNTIDPMLATAAQVMLTSMFSFAVCTFFLSHAYDFPLLVSSGVSIAIFLLAGQSRAPVAKQDEGERVLPSGVRPRPLRHRPARPSNERRPLAELPTQVG